MFDHMGSGISYNASQEVLPSLQQNQQTPQGSRHSKRAKPVGFVNKQSDSQVNSVVSTTPSVARPSLSKNMPLCFRENPGQKQRARPTQQANNTQPIDYK